MELREGMYVRTDNGIIGKIYEKIGDMFTYKDSNRDYITYGGLHNEILKASHNIIDLIEVGDYVNGYKVSFKGDDYQPFVQCDYPVEEGTTNHYRFYEEAIYSIVTKEQFESMKYEVK